MESHYPTGKADDMDLWSDTGCTAQAVGIVGISNSQQFISGSVSFH